MSRDMSADCIMSYVLRIVFSCLCIYIYIANSHSTLFHAVIHLDSSVANASRTPNSAAVCGPPTLRSSSANIWSTMSALCADKAAAAASVPMTTAVSWPSRAFSCWPVDGPRPRLTACTGAAQGAAAAVDESSASAPMSVIASMPIDRSDGRGCVVVSGEMRRCTLNEWRKWAMRSLFG